MACFLTHAEISRQQFLRIFFPCKDLFNRQFHRLTHKYISACVLLFQACSSHLAEGVLYQAALQFLFQLLALVILGQKRSCLYIYEPCSHFQKISCVLVVLFFKTCHVLQILFQQHRYLDIVDVQLVLGDKVEQQVERTLKHIQFESGC